MNSLVSWFHMNGYGFFVWSSYTLVFLVMIANIWSLNWRKKRVQQQLRQWFRDQ